MEKTKNCTHLRPLPIKSIKIGGCFVRATLDPRNPSRAGARYVVLVYYISGSSRLYQQLPYVMTPSDYDVVQHSTGRGRPTGEDITPYDIKCHIIDDFDAAVQRLVKLAGRSSITLQMLHSFLGSKVAETFTDFWAQFNLSKSVGTRNA